MTVSLMSILGGNVNLSAAAGSEGSADAGLTSDVDAAFDAIMTASKMGEVSAEKLRDFFAAHGANIPTALKNTDNTDASQVLVQILAANNGKKLPGEMIVALQEMLPQEMVDAVELSLSQIQGENIDLQAELPQRELTPEELSQLVQETGFPPVVIFAALQDSPAASPNLAYAMVDDMGAAEADANLPLPHGKPAPVVDLNAFAKNMAAATAGVNANAQGQQMASPAADASAKAAASSANQQGVQGAQIASQIASVDFSMMDESKRDVLKRIVDVLRGEKPQAEFDWGAAAKPVAANANEKAAQATAKANGADAQLMAKAQIASDGAQQKPHITTNGQSADMALNLQNAVQNHANNGATQQPQGAQPVNAAADMPQGATQSTATSVDTPQTSFAASLEQSSSLRGAGATDTVQAQLRHTPMPQGTPAEQVTVHISKMVADGGSKMEIHLKPHELGRVDVRIETDAAGRSQVIVTADKRDTLDMLQKDARGLERALADAGLKTDSSSLSFNLRGGEGQQQAQQDSDGRSGKPAFDLNANYDELDERLGESEMALTYDIGRAYRLNIDNGVDISV